MGRALAKNPLDRFATCRQFIEQLQKVRCAPTHAAPTQEQDDTHKKDSSVNAAKLGASLQDTTDCKREFKPAIRLDDRNRDFAVPRSMYIGLGGMGCEALLQLRTGLRKHCDARLAVDEHGWLAIDTTAEHLEHVLQLDGSDGLPSNKTVQVPIFKPIEYHGSDPNLLKPISRRWLYNIPKSLCTEGVRPIAVLAMLDHYESLKSKIKKEVSELVNAHRRR